MIFNMANDITQHEKTNIEPSAAPIETSNMQKTETKQGEIVQGKENLGKSPKFGSTLQLKEGRDLKNPRATCNYCTIDYACNPKTCGI